MYGSRIEIFKQVDLSIPAQHTTSKKLDRKFVSAVVRLQNKVIQLPQNVKRLIAGVIDLLSAFLSIWMAFSLRLEFWVWPVGEQWVVVLLAPLLMLPVFVFSGVYNAVHRYNGISVFVMVARAVAVYGALFFLTMLMFSKNQVPHSIGLLQPMMLLLLTGGSRALPRIFFAESRRAENNNVPSKRILIYGAGSAGVQIAHEICESPKFLLVGFIDDNEELHGRTINGKPVFDFKKAAAFMESDGIDMILMAIPSACRRQRNAIVEKLRGYQVRIQMLPGVDALMDGRVTMSDIKEVEIEDLLGRDPVMVDSDLMAESVAGKVVMVTGAGGSIGSELCRQLLAIRPSTLVLVDNGELNLYKIQHDLDALSLRMDSRTAIVPILGNVTDKRRMDSVCGEFRPSVIYHAAAYKHVPMVEHNPAEGVRNNVLGTLVIADVALGNRVPRVVLVSTDKAVRPTNVMGASKRLCEMIMQAFADRSGHATCFSIVRFGNVLGSSGSVIPLFRQQIKGGGPITITHKDITRYFMTIPEASQLVIQAGAIAQGGDLFLLDMGAPVKIIDLARRMVELSGLTIRDQDNSQGDIEIRYTGLRSGEKLYEELLIGDHAVRTERSGIWRAHEPFKPWKELKPALDELLTAADFNDITTLKQMLRLMVTEYEPSDLSLKRPLHDARHSHLEPLLNYSSTNILI